MPDRRLDTYEDYIVPDADFETCLKVIRTVRNACLGPNFFDANGAVLLSHAHAKLVDLETNARRGEAAEQELKAFGADCPQMEDEDSDPA